MGLKDEQASFETGKVSLAMANDPVASGNLHGDVAPDLDTLTAHPLPETEKRVTLESGELR
jgi:hypothetical protein